MRLNGIKKMILAIFLSIFAIIYVPITVKGENIPIRTVGLTANDAAVHTTTFYLPRDRQIYYWVSASLSSQTLRWYARLKKDGNTVCNLNSGYHQISLSKGNYTIEAYGGGWFSGGAGEHGGYSGYGTVSVTLKYAEYGTLVHLESNNGTATGSFSLRIRTKVYYIWSGGVTNPPSPNFVGRFNPAYFQITGPVSINEGPSPQSNGSFIGESGVYNVALSGGNYTPQYYHTIYVGGTADIWYDDTPFTDVITTNIADLTTGPDGAKYTNKRTINLTWTNTVDTVRKYRILDGSTNITPGGYTTANNAQLIFDCDGSHNLKVESFDDSGNRSLDNNSQRIIFHIDTVCPTGTLYINGTNKQPPYTNDRSVTLHLETIHDSGEIQSGFYQMRFSDDGTDYSAWESFSANKIYLIQSAGDGVKTIYAEVMDYAGNIAAFQNSITLDTQPPVNCAASVDSSSEGLTIVSYNWVTYVRYNDPANSKPIRLNLSAYDATSGVCGIEFDGVINSELDPITNHYTGYTSWDPGAVDGVKQVNVAFRDQAGNVSGPIPVIVILDNTGPTGSFTINEGAYTRSTLVTLNLSASDEAGGVTGMRFSNTETSLNDAEWEPFAATKTWTLNDGDGLKTVYVQYQDQCGNISAAYSNVITLDITPPPMPDVTVSPAGRTNNTRPTIFFSSTDSGSGINRYELSIDGGAFSPVTSPYTLPAQTEGEHTVKVRAVDNAGLTGPEAAATVIIDLTPPGAPGNFRHTFGDGGQMTIHWQGTIPDGDLAKFVVSYTPPFGIGTTMTEVTPVIINDARMGAFNIQLTGYASNQPVTIEVYAADQAGNQSATVSYTAYTPAALGELSFLGVDYDPDTGHQLKWQVGALPGQAQNYALEYGNITGEGFTAFGRVYAASNGLIIHNALAGGAKLQPHAIYHYRLAAFNNSGDPSYGEPFEQQVPNIAPARPAVLSPLQYARTITQFTYQPATDPDGDPLTYQIYLGQGTDPATFELLPDGMAGNLINGQTYTWYVTATDSYGGVTTSDRVRFTVDGNAPKLTVSEPRRPYTNQTQLTVTANDGLSGIDKITWQMIDAVTNLQVETGTVELDGTLSGIIRLPQGNYHIHVTAWDKAGNSNEVQLNNLMVDRTNPRLTGLNVNLTQSGNRYVSGSTKVPVTFSAGDDLSGIGALSYALVQNQGQPLANGSLIQLRPGFDNYNYRLETTAQPGREYYLAAAIRDAAGNSSDVQYYGPILFDLTAPVVDLTLEGLVKHGATNYLADLNHLNVNVNAADPETNLIRTGIAIVDANQTMVSGWGDWEAVKQNTVLISGTQYRITVRAENEAGLITQKWSPEFIYDNTPPEMISIQGPAGTVAGGEQAVIRIAAQDQESGITEYRLAICLEAPSDYKLTSLIPGNRDGWLIIQPTANPLEIRLELPAGASGNYYPIIQATNGAGLIMYNSGTKFTLSHNAEKVSTGDQGPYSMFSDRLSGAWQYLGARPITGYRYRIIGPDQSGTDWQTTMETAVTVTGLDLESGKTYRFEVQAVYGDGTFTESSYSPGVTIDTTAPEIISLVTPECATSDNLRFQWTGNDSESGIGLVQAALGSDYYQTDITGGWVTITGNNPSLTCNANGTALSLETGKRYYLTLRLTNGAGLTTAAIANGVIIDDTPPPVPVVFDQGAYINPKQPLQANWIWSPADPESGPDSYQWTLIKEGQDLDTAVWQNGTENKRIQINEAQIKELFPYLSGGLSPDGSTYYFAVRATNRAGLTSTGVSNGIMVDSSAPFIPEVKLLNAVNLGDPDATEINYITSNQNLGLWISSFDPETPIDQYLYAFGTPAAVDAQIRQTSEQSQIRLQDPAIDEGVITLFAGECSNQAQLVSATGYSSGVVLDTGAPKIINVRGGVCGNRLFFDWDVISSISPVGFYEVALVKSSEVNSIPANWTNTGLKRSIVLDGAALSDGKYCLLIRATNQAGTVSRRAATIDEWGTSPVVMLDRTPPEIVNLSYDKYASKQLTLQIEASDNLAGINGYQYAVGSLAEPFKYSGGWNDINSQSETIAYAMNTGNIAHNSAVYLMVRTADKAGLWSKPAISGKIIIDHTKPETPKITSGQYAASKTVIGGIQFVSGDPESGITHYRLGITTQPGAGWLAVQVRPIDEFNGQLDGLNLNEGGTYYLAVQIQNGAGDWSDTGYSAPITVDTIAPELIFSKAGSAVVINQPPVDIEFTLSEAAQVELNLTTGNGTLTKYSINGKPGVNQFTFTESQPDTYTLTAQATDPAGNIGPTGAGQIQIIWVNAPPKITLPAEINATPGQPLNLTAAVVDPDGTGGEVLTYQWNPGDGSGLLTGLNPEYRYTRTGEYTLILTVTDKDGGVTIANTIVKIANTTRGSLYMDEVWSGEHHIYADVTVPEGVHLTISPGTRVIIDGIPGATGYNHALIIQGGLTVQNGAGFQSVNGTVDNGWQGIYITGQATLDGANIYHALRGITVMNTANVTVSNSSFMDNYIGIHVYGSNPRIDTCQFINNQWYGIKEDQGGRPVVTNCGFNGNEVAYYQDGVSEITIDELNQIPGNSGNYE